jgi:biopolymer transport protein ExbB/TolQ
MPAMPLEPACGAGHSPGVEGWVAVLEQIAKSTAASLERIERRIEALAQQIDTRITTESARLDRRMDALETNQRADPRWLVGVMIGMFGTMIAGFGGLLAVMAHGFHRL